MIKVIGKIKIIIKEMVSKVAGKKNQTWRDNEYFDDLWKKRIRLMASFLPAGTSVMDLGCGRMWLKDCLQLAKYVPVDYCERGPDTRICDFNLGQFPDEKTEYAFVSGCLEYVNNPEWFVSKIAEHSDKCIVSYCTIDERPDLKARRSNYWVNDLSRANLIHLFDKVGMQLIDEALHQPSNNIFVFSK
jgi:hypothetical protein